MRRFLPYAIILVAVLVGGALLLHLNRNSPNANGAGGNQQTNRAATSGPARGVSFSPRGSSASDLVEFATRAREAGTLLTWAGPSTDLGKSSGGSSVVRSIADRNGLTPIYLVGIDAPALYTAEPASLLTNSIVDFARTEKPRYLGIGNEINRWAAGDADIFVRWFSDLVPMVHQVSPKTRVFTTLQYENLQGRYDGLFGGTNDPARTRWDLLDQLAAADFLGFTSYPGLVFPNPADVPETYYAAIAEHTNKPFAFTEIGWFRTSPGGTGWDSSAEEQAAFIERFRAIAPTETEFVIWPFVFDPSSAPQPFRSMGLLAADQTDGPAWRAWLAP